MTLAVSDPTSTKRTDSLSVPIAILGTDALRVALPATPVQLAHACLQAGFVNVIPASWGDELIAAEVLRQLSEFGAGPVIHCSCPIVAHRLLTVGGDLRPAMLPLVSPPVALSRYLRALSHPDRLRVTYVGSCPGAADESIDIRMTPEALVSMLAEREIVPEEQPLVFESVMPPDRRRFRSQPGGLPTPEALWNQVGSRTVVELFGEDVAGELAQHLLNGKNVLIDASARLGCHCSGASADVTPAEARAGVVALEPPRSATPVVDVRAPITLSSPVPAASRTPIDVAAVAATHAAAETIGAASGADAAFGNRLSPIRGVVTVPELQTDSRAEIQIEARPARASNPALTRQVQGVVPVTRDPEGRSLPRTYIARRRSSPRSIPAVVVPVVAPAIPAAALAARPLAGARGAPTVESSESPPSASSAVTQAERPDVDQARPGPMVGAPGAASWPISPRQVLYLVIAALAIIVGVSAAVAVAVERSASVQPPAPTVPAQR